MSALADGGEPVFLVADIGGFHTILDGISFHALGTGTVVSIFALYISLACDINLELFLAGIFGLSRCFDTCIPNLTLKISGGGTILAAAGSLALMAAAAVAQAVSVSGAVVSVYFGGEQTVGLL